jgi:hypothetical protein
MQPCRECKHQISEQAAACPNCGAPFPAQAVWDGRGYEYKSRATFLGYPMLHISFKYRPTGVPVVARGIIAVGQFGVGVVNISQFGVGVVSIGQFTIAGFALAQFAFAWELIAQIGIYVNKGYGQLVISLAELLGKLS